MKKIFRSIFSFIFISIIFYSITPHEKTKTQVIISVDNLLTVDVIESLEEELNSYNNIKFIEGSILTSIIVLEDLDSEFEIQPINAAFNRWGCNIENIDYRMLN